MHRDRVFKKVGEALFLAQTLELNVRSIIAVLNRQFGAGIDAKLIVHGNDKHTLGQLIQEMKKRGDLNEGAASTLKDALVARNYVAHHFFTRNVAVFESGQKSASALEKLQQCTKQIAAATLTTEAFLRGFCEVFKIDAAGILVEQDIA